MTKTHLKVGTAVESIRLRVRHFGHGPPKYTRTEKEIIETAHGLADRLLLTGNLHDMIPVVSHAIIEHGLTVPGTPNKLTSAVVVYFLMGELGQHRPLELMAAQAGVDVVRFNAALTTYMPRLKQLFYSKPYLAWHVPF